MDVPNKNMKCTQLSGEVIHHHRGKSSSSLSDKGVILKELNIKLGEIILDAGCGNGYMAKEFAKLVKDSGKVYALDTDEVSISILKTQITNTVIEPFVGDVTRKTRFKNNCIDMIYLSTVIHGFSKLQMQGFIREAKRILKDKGRLAILEIAKKDTPFGPPMEKRISPEELKQRIKLSSVKTVDIGSYFYLQIFKN
jgi:ubiquinone/menaquinone biosynthesis C-methylase UbiE